MSGAPRILVLPILFSLVAACGLPRDPEKASNRIASTHELRVGVSDNPPWTIARGGQPAGPEPDLVRRFAEQIGAHVRWRRGSESTLVHALEEHDLDLVIGGFDKKTQWSTTAGLSQPFAKDADGKQHVLLAAAGENQLILSVDRFLAEQKRRSS
jgi:ABC-type amino acid transport substrate-binding protein